MAVGLIKKHGGIIGRLILLALFSSLVETNAISAETCRLVRETPQSEWMEGLTFNSSSIPFSEENGQRVAKVAGSFNSGRALIYESKNGSLILQNGRDTNQKKFEIKIPVQKSTSFGLTAVGLMGDVFPEHFKIMCDAPTADWVQVKGIHLLSVEISELAIFQSQNRYAFTPTFGWAPYYYLSNKFGIRGKLSAGMPSVDTSGQTLFLLDAEVPGSWRISNPFSLEVGGGLLHGSLPSFGTPPVLSSVFRWNFGRKILALADSIWLSGSEFFVSNDTPGQQIQLGIQISR